MAKGAAKRITIRLDDAIKMVRHLSYLVVSLDRIGSDKRVREIDNQHVAWRFLIEGDVTRKAAWMRKVLEEALDRALTEPEIRAFERKAEKWKHWKWE